MEFVFHLYNCIRRHYRNSSRALALSLVLGLSLSVSAATGVDLRNYMVRELDIIQQTFELRYGMKEWKKDHLGWDAGSQIVAAKLELQGLNSPNAVNYRSVLLDFFKSTQDYHVGVYFLSTEAATLPFQIKGAGGQFFIVWVDRDKLDKDVYPIQVGDRVVSLGGEPIERVVADVQSKVGHNVPGTDRALAELYVTRRRGMLGQEVPRGPVDLVIAHSTGSGEILKTYPMNWDYVPEIFPPVQPDVRSLMANSGARITSGANKHFLNESFRNPYDWQMTASFWRAFKGETTKASDNNFLVGRKKSFVPELGTKIWEAPEDWPLYAYIYQNADQKKIGYVRIPSYEGQDDVVELWPTLIQKMEESADALVIDQVNNPGGSVFYLYSILSYLIDKPVATTPMRMTILPEDVVEAQANLAQLSLVTSDDDARQVFGDTIVGYPVTYQVAKNFESYFQFLVDQWKNWAGGASKPYLLSDYHYLGLEKILPNPKASFTRPILVLVNELDFSGGDFFPAMLQDAGRAKIFGTRTAGAGGYVLNVSYPNFFGVEGFTITGSIAKRANGQPIENLGVTPDIPYELTAEDLKSGLKNYKDAINAAVQGLLGAADTNVQTKP